jgi:hypothetical protein
MSTPAVTAPRGPTRRRTTRARGRAPTETAVASLHRALAHRGRQEPLYRELSDHWTQILQRLFPVWVLLGPGLADPAHIEMRSRTIYLDSDRLLGTRAEILAGALERWRILVTFGAGIHETFHAKHTKRWVVAHDEALGKDQLAVDRILLEEPRMEAHGVRAFPAATLRGRFVRAALHAAVLDVILAGFLQRTLLALQAGAPVSRDLCGRAMTYLQARTLSGVVDVADLAPLQQIWRSVLGETDVRALQDLYARLVWIPDGDNPALTESARRYREIIGPPDPSPPSAGDGEPGSAATGGAGAGGHATQSPISPGGSFTDALEQMIAASKTRGLEQLRHDVVLEDLLHHAATGRASSSTLAGGGGTGAPSGRLPDRGVERPPFPDEVQQARRYATRLAQAHVRGHRLFPKRTPGGRFNSRQYVRARSERATRRPVSSHPWHARRDVHAPLLEPHVGLVIDTSGSMGGVEYALGPIAWILQAGLATFGGRLAIGLFGNGAELLTDGRRPMPLVPGIQTGGGTAFAGDAIVMVADELDMETRTRPRFVYVLSDGGWYDTEAGVEKIRWLDDLGVPTIHISIGAEPLSVEAARISVIEDPADALDIVARDTVEALRLTSRAR